MIAWVSILIRSIATYGAPVWADRPMSRGVKALLRSAQRAPAVRVVRGYRTVSWAAATALAGDPPWDLVASVLAEVFSYVSGRRALGENPSSEEIRAVRRQGESRLMREWGEDLAGQPYGKRTTAALRPVLERWMRRKRKPLTFRLTQVFTGHGCFGDYLCRTARREPGSGCHECGAAVDSAQHTLEVCPRWAAQRQDLVAALGGVDLSLSSIAEKMLESDRSWLAVSSFCETVMSTKEASEREREDAADAPSLRRRRTGVRRWRYLQRLQ
nr:uncharacterized protein LOC116776031 [Danaus plexippus plexippus]